MKRSAIRPSIPERSEDPLVEVSLVVNGQPIKRTVSVRMLLSDFLRHELGLTGTHVGCEHGVCGCCTVHIDGKAGRSCLTFAVQANGCHIRTIEAVAAEDGALHPIQQAFKECHALHAAFMRRPVARPRIKKIDVSAARNYPGVAAVYTCDDIGPLDMAMPLLIPHPSMKNPKTQRPLARGDVYYVGQTIAMVVAVDRYTAEDAAALIEVEYEHLPVEMDMKRALQNGAPLVHADVPNNLAAHFIQTSGDPDAAFARAEHFTKIEVQVDRSTAAPMECRAVAARWDAVSGELTVWDGTQAPISVRGGLASIFNLDEDKVRVIAPDVGGGFGQKVHLFYPDELLVPMAAMQLGRPVKYIEDRRENFIGSSQEGNEKPAIELAALKTGDGV